MVQNTDRRAQDLLPEAETLGRRSAPRSPGYKIDGQQLSIAPLGGGPVAVRKPVPGLTNRGEVLARRLAETCFSFEAEKRSSLRSHPARLFTLTRFRFWPEPKSGSAAVTFAVAGKPDAELSLHRPQLVTRIGKRGLRMMIGSRSRKLKFRGKQAPREKPAVYTAAPLAVRLATGK